MGTNDAKTALKEAISKAGGPGVLGRSLKITSQAISQWAQCPPDKVLVIEALTGVPCWRLRPDLYPPGRFAPTTEPPEKRLIGPLEG